MNGEKVCWEKASMVGMECQGSCDIFSHPGSVR